jgi:flagellar hook-length control protein FliK
VNDLGNALLSLLPVQTGGSTAGTASSIAGKSRRTAPAGIRFSDVLNVKKIDPSSPGALAQLTTLVANGTPISTIASQLAADIVKSVDATSPSGTSDADALTKIITAGLSPPGKGPPTTTAAQQVVALARRLTTIVTAVAREADAAGQQNDLSGSILDADSAKETPAPLKTAPLSNGIDAGALVQSLLSQVAAQLQPGSVVSAATTADAEGTSTVASRPTLRVAQDSSPGQGSGNSEATQAAAAATPSASDLLGRMVARAAAVDARLNGAPAVTAVRSANRPTSTPSALFARLIQTVAQSSRSSGNPSSQSSWDQLRRFDKAAVTSTKTTVANAAAVPGNAAPATANPGGKVAGPSTGQSAAAAYDPEAILSQVVRGLSIRTGDGTQEVRLNLQPEHLGEVSLKLIVDGSSVSASVVAQNADVANTLSSNQHQLARAFADAGLKLTSFTVDVSGGNTPGSPQQRDTTQGFGRHFAVHETTDAQTEADLDAVPTFGPPISTSAAAGLLNQLA